jgi:hypothetical protein
MRSAEPAGRVPLGWASLESKAYRAWIITPTPNGTHFWTEETMQRPLWIIFSRTHQRLLEYLAKVATKRSGSPTR